MTATNPHHGYLTEPRYHIEVVSTASKDRPDEMTSGELARGTVSLPDPDSHLTDTARNTVRELTCLDTWAQLAAIGAVLVVIMIIAG